MFACAAATAGSPNSTVRRVVWMGAGGGGRSERDLAMRDSRNKPRTENSVAGLKFLGRWGLRIFFFCAGSKLVLRT